jgi:peptidoglycan/LPS O-acetylase OafA/YrhL
MEQKENNRLRGFDSLRFFMIFLVIVFHVSITFMEYAPQYWYVLDDQKSIIFTILVMFLDGFPVTILFFLAGYFSKPSFEKNGIRNFLLDKSKRIGIPWLIGVFLIAPFFAYMSYQSYHLPAITALKFITTMFFGTFYMQAHYWYLGILFFLFLFYAVYEQKANKTVKVKQDKHILVILSTWIVSIAAYYGSTLIKSSDTWLNVCFVLYFQQSRLIGYIMIFLLGVYAYKRNWFAKDGWSPNWIVWGTIGINVIIFSFFWNMIITWIVSDTIRLIINAVLYNTITITATLFLTGLFSKFQKPLYKLTSRFSSNSYGIYWLHLIILTAILHWFKQINIAIPIKWFLCIILTLLICQITTKYIFKKILSLINAKNNDSYIENRKNGA